MHTETLSVGTELTSGSTIDTNVAWLAGQLAQLGLTIRRHTTLPDDLASLVAHVRGLRAGASEPTLLVVTGGLGPTLDDLTRDAVAAALELPLVEDTACRQAIEAMFRHRGWPMASSNLRQAQLPQGATALPNSCGTAPGFYVHSDRLHIVVMPGVPYEMKAMYAEQVEPIVRRLAPGGRVVAARILHTFGLGESTVGQTIADNMARGRNPNVGTTAASGMVSVRIWASAASADEAAAMLDAEEADLRRKLGHAVVGCGEEGLPQAVAQLLTTSGATAAVAESCTGGLVSKLLTDVPGSSAFFLETAVTYTNAAKTARLGVPTEWIAQHGAVSEPVARSMAEGMRSLSGADYALATTGIAGPSGGTDAKPVGLVFVALASADGTVVRRLHLPGDRDRVRHRTALAALNLLRLRLLNVPLE
ncbi:MAG: competence/damage-inducible protein A [Phycisphaerae bacterium]|nr:competence/damage-inducible protein A [Phycisphaerae bacterium]